MTIFQCIQIRKLGLVKILRLSCSTCINQKWNVVSSNNKQWTSLKLYETVTSLGHKKYLFPKILVRGLICEWNLWTLQHFIEINLSVKSQNVLHVQFFLSCIYSVPLKVVYFVYCLSIWLRCIAGICLNGMNFKFHTVIRALFVWDHFELQTFFTCPKVTATQK